MTVQGVPAPTRSNSLVALVIYNRRLHPHFLANTRLRVTRMLGGVLPVQRDREDRHLQRTTTQRLFQEMGIEPARHPSAGLNVVSAAVASISLPPPPSLKFLDPLRYAKRINALDGRRNAGNPPRAQPTQPPLPARSNIIFIAVSWRQNGEARAKQCEKKETPPRAAERIPAPISEVTQHHDSRIVTGSHDAHHGFICLFRRCGNPIRGHDIRCKLYF